MPHNFNVNFVQAKMIGFKAVHTLQLFRKQFPIVDNSPVHLYPAQFIPEYFSQTVVGASLLALMILTIVLKYVLIGLTFINCISTFFKLTSWFLRQFFLVPNRKMHEAISYYFALFGIYFLKFYGTLLLL
jgi:hypothetical protein